MANSNPRPLSPHLTVWRWGPHMAASILHRITGSGLTVVGLGMLTWWLWAASAGSEAYDRFIAFAGSLVGVIILVGLTWAFFQHLLSGIRHLVMDSGAGFELTANKRFAILTMVGSLLLTALTWAYIFGVFA